MFWCEEGFITKEKFNLDNLAPDLFEVSQEDKLLSQAGCMTILNTSSLFDYVEHETLSVEEYAVLTEKKGEYEAFV